MQIGFIGAGKVGTAFGKYLVNNGFNVSGYFSKSYTSANTAAKITASVAYRDLEQLIAQTDIIFITTPDDVIEQVCEELTGLGINPNQIICHMSGALSSKVLKSASNKGCSVFSVHPLQSFADINISVSQLENTFFCIEGTKETMGIIKDMLNSLGNNFSEIDEEKKIIYHAAACVFSNYLVTLYAYGLHLLDQIGIEQKTGVEAVQPLVEGTLENIANMGVVKALTGPIVRGDIKTVGKHLAEIKRTCPDQIDLYKVLGRQTVQLAQKKGLAKIDKLYFLNYILEGEK